MTKDTTLLVATVKDEGPHLLEWVAYHRLCGFDRIQIYQNDSTDTTAQTLKHLDRIGAVEYHENRHPDGAYQMRAYRRASRSETFKSSDWCMALDGDEFLQVKVGGRTARDLIAACPDGTEAVMVNWRVFGSSGEEDLSNQLVTERFTRAEPADAIRAAEMAGYKTLFRTDCWARPGVHLPRLPAPGDRVVCNGSGLADGTFERKNWRGLDPGGRQFAQVHHYMLRDLSSFLLKHDRGSANAPHRDVGLDYWRTYDRNEEEDLSLAGRAFEIRAEMKKLDEMADGKLMPLRQRAIRHWRIARDNLLEREDMRALRDAIRSAAPSEPMAQKFRMPSGAQPVFSSVRSSPLVLRRKLASG